MKVKVLKNFKDIKENTRRTVGDIFIASKERVGEINSTPFGVLVEEIKEGSTNEKRRTIKSRKSCVKDIDK